MINFQVTLGAAATRVSKEHMWVKELQIQDNSAHIVRVGHPDTVTATVGLLLKAGNPSASPAEPGGMIKLGPLASDREIDLYDIALYGTENDVIDVGYLA